MLRKSLMTIVMFSLFLFIFQSHLFAAEPKHQYFGVDATVQAADSGEHIVKNKGNKG